MAWFVMMDSRNRGDEDETYLSPEIEVIPEEQKRYETMGKAFAQKLIDDYRAAGKNPYEYPIVSTEPDYPYFMPYVLTPMREGWRWPTLSEPLRDRLKSKEGKLVDIIGSSFNTYAISQRVIDIIESIEPDVHQYLPYELIQKDGSVHPDKRWLLNVCTRIEALDYERSNVIALRDMPRFYHDRNTGHHLVARKEAVANRALWYEYRYKNSNGQFLLSDRFWDALSASGCAGWRPEYGVRGKRIEEI
jgi:Protein of unknown function (DUF1629)